MNVVVVCSARIGHDISVSNVTSFRQDPLDKFKATQNTCSYYPPA